MKYVFLMIDMYTFLKVAAYFFTTLLTYKYYITSIYNNN